MSIIGTKKRQISSAIKSKDQVNEKELKVTKDTSINKGLQNNTKNKTTKINKFNINQFVKKTRRIKNDSEVLPVINERIENSDDFKQILTTALNKNLNDNDKKYSDSESISEFSVKSSYRFKQLKTEKLQNDLNSDKNIKVKDKRKELDQTNKTSENKQKCKIKENSKKVKRKISVLKNDKQINLEKFSDKKTFLPLDEFNTPTSNDDVESTISNKKRKVKSLVCEDLNSDIKLEKNKKIKENKQKTLKAVKRKSASEEIIKPVGNKVPYRQDEESSNSDNINCIFEATDVKSINQNKKFLQSSSDEDEKKYKIQKRNNDDESKVSNKKRKEKTSMSKDLTSDVKREKNKKCKPRDKNIRYSQDEESSNSDNISCIFEATDVKPINQNKKFLQSNSDEDEKKYKIQKRNNDDESKVSNKKRKQKTSMSKDLNSNVKEEENKKSLTNVDKHSKLLGNNKKLKKCKKNPQKTLKTVKRKSASEEIIELVGKNFRYIQDKKFYNNDNCVFEATDVQPINDNKKFLQSSSDEDEQKYINRSFRVVDKVPSKKSICSVQKFPKENKKIYFDE